MLGSLAALILAGAVSGGGESPANPSPRESIEVKVRGTLRTGLMAIGGETTGYAITARGVTWELDFGKDDKLRKTADGLNGHLVVVTGTLDVRAGVEMKSRSIVTVDEIAPADNPPAPEPRRPPQK
jgi:hypothetical protein